MLLTEEVIMKWNENNRKWYESKGYVFTKYNDEFEVKVKDLSDGTSVKVNVKCDNCGEIIYDVIWNKYIKYISENNGKYYCPNCIRNIFNVIKIRETKLKKSISFYDWCYENLSKYEADIIMLRWDYEKNIDLDGSILNPNDVLYKSSGFNKKGYWFKCLDHPEHESEQKKLHSFIVQDKSTICKQCNCIASTHTSLTKYFVNEEDSHKYSFGSTKKVLFKCPNCGYEKRMKISRFIESGFACNKCSDTISYPEKFMFNMLEQLLGKEFQTQLSKKTLKWCDKYFYDFFINKYNCIIETHGLQHYEENGYKWHSLKETQENDRQKELLAKNNGICNYIVLDCRYSKIEWIKKSIMLSELPSLLNFKEENIDWLQCHEAGCSSLVKVACDLWNNGIKNTLEISNKMKLSRTKTTIFLKQGVLLNMCDYDPKEEHRKRDILAKENKSVKVVCITTGEVFDSVTLAVNKYSGHISDCCHGKRKYAGKHPETGEKLVWMYYDEYLKTIGGENNK